MFMTRIRFLVLVVLLMLVPAGRVAATSYTLSVTTQGSGTISTNPIFATYPANVSVTLTATPNAGWYFANWSGAVIATTNPVNVTMTGNLSITGLFLAYPTYSLTLATNGLGTIALSPPGGSYLSNTLVTATAAPATGWIFTGWSGATNGNTNPLSLTIDNNTVLTANFAELPAFTVQPQSQTNVVGSTVTFYSYSVGAVPLSYQWYFSSAALAGATNSTLKLANSLASQAGFYQVVATNVYGSATSSVAALVLDSASESTNVVSVCNEADLQAAISAGGWISIGCSGTITLTNTLNISKNVFLDGSGVSAIISGGNTVQLFTVAAGVSFAITNLTLADGNCLVTNGSAPAEGGAICNNGGLVTLTGCTVSNNIAQALVSSGVAEGGAIGNNGGSVSLFGTTVCNNTVVGGVDILIDGAFLEPGGTAYGGAIYNNNGSLLVSQCVITNNSCLAAANGGGCFGGALFQASGYLLVTNSLLAQNLALGDNAYYYSFGDISPATPACGGALAAQGGYLTMALCQFIGNTAQGGAYGLDDTSLSGAGGALYSTANLAIANCSFSQNQALAGASSITYNRDVTGDGGAIYNAGSAMLNSSCLFSNVAQGASASAYNGLTEPGGDGLGGGIFNAGRMTATNCTIALNSAVNGPGTSGDFGTSGPNGNAWGGGICNTTNALFEGVNVTIASNSCFLPVAGSAYGAEIANVNGTLELLNSLLAYGGTTGNAYGTITDLGDNISSDGSAIFESGSSFNFTDPLLGPLADNGGPTLTMALSPESPAIAFANSTDGAPPDDQRGYARPTGMGVIDLGAYQSGASQIYNPAPTISLSIGESATNVVVSFTTTPAITNTLHFQSSTNLINWTDLETFGAFPSSSNISETISPQGATHMFFRLRW
jgi:uncharacterized repeat protein (TIGR02543 family)